MARLGSVLGAILAELARARLVSDELSKTLAAEYRGDPILASMSIPRLVLDEVALTLRFSVSDLVEAPVTTPDAGTLRDDWIVFAETNVVPGVLERFQIPQEDRATVMDIVKDTAGVPVGIPTISDVRTAVGGDRKPAVAATVAPVLDAWTSLPAGIRSVIGTKTTFRRELERDLAEQFGLFVDRQQELALVQAALASELQVAVVRDQLPEDPSLMQEFRLTVRGQDLDVLVQPAAGSA
jgi:hypothetical protein